MRILKVQPTTDPRSYKIIKALAIQPEIEIFSALYSGNFYSDAYSMYADNAAHIGPPTFPDNKFGKSMNMLINYNLWPNNLIISNKINKISKLKKIELIHTNNPPDFLGSICKKNSGLPVIHEIYDTISLVDYLNRRKEPITLENNPFKIVASEYLQNRILKYEELVHNKCDALIFTSEEMRKYSIEKYGNFRSIVVPNGVLKEFLPKIKNEKISKKDGKIHCVYLGAIRSNSPHRRIISQIRQIAKCPNVVLHLYPVTTSIIETNQLINDLIKHKNIIIHSPLHYRELYREISMYDVGLVILNPSDERLLSTALPNKIFEYAAAGLPSAVPDYESLRNFVKLYRCGFIVHDWESDITNNMCNVKEIPFHEEFTLDYYISKLTKLYKSFTI